MDTNLFFGGQDEEGDDEDPRKETGRMARVQLAKSICAGCPVKQPCLDDALMTGDKYGIRGGKTFRERRHMKRRTK